MSTIISQSFVKIGKKKLLIGHLYNAICASFIYNRVDDACFIYDKNVETPNCDIHSGVPLDNPSDCINPEDKCEVSCILDRRHVW